MSQMDSDQAKYEGPLLEDEGKATVSISVENEDQNFMNESDSKNEPAENQADQNEIVQSNQVEPENQADQNETVQSNQEEPANQAVQNEIAQSNQEEPAENHENQVELHNKTFNFTNASALKETLEKLPKSEDKLSLVIAFMEWTLSQKGTPQFKDFWEARSLCLELFKTQLPPALRSIMWEKYSDLSKEARRLKEIFDEKSAFAMEQIGEAIKGIEEEVDHIEEKVEGVPEVDLPIKSKSLMQNLSQYQNLQRELNLYHTLASRITSLRKELIKTEMRVRFKNQFFQRLSSLGDRIFPRRKELIQKISQLFLSDVEDFANSSFEGDRVKGKPFVARDEVKALQAAAKSLTLNTGTFNQTRKILGECWDKLRKMDKEFKKERAERKIQSQENADPILKEVQELQEALNANNISLSDANQKLISISRSMRQVDLDRDDVQKINAELNEAKNAISALHQVEEKKRLERQKEQEIKKQEAILKVREETVQLEKNAESGSAEELASKLDEIQQLIASTEIPQHERKALLEGILPLQDSIYEKREDELLKTLDEDSSALKEMRQVLNMRRERRLAIKDRIEEIRKALGGSGLDFEQSLQYNEQLRTQKERLDQIDHSIEELQRLIASKKK